MLRLHRHLHVSLAQEPADKNRWLVPSPGIDTPGGYRKGQHARWRHCARRARRHRARRSFFRSPLPRARARSAAALALPLSRADAHLVAVYAAAAAAAAAAAPTDDACGNVHARPRHYMRRVRRHRARHKLFRIPLPLARTRCRSLACSLSRAPRKSDVSPFFSFFFLKKQKEVTFSQKCELRTRLFWCRDSSSSLVTQGPRRRKRAGVDPSRHIFPRIFSTIGTNEIWRAIWLRSQMARPRSRQVAGSALR